jgi:hypothetical protein
MRNGSVFRGGVKVGALGGDLSHAVSLECEAVGVVDEPVEDGVGDGGIGDDLVPVLNRHLAGDNGRSALVAWSGPGSRDHLERLVSWKLGRSFS